MRSTRYTDFDEFSHSVQDVVIEMTPVNVRRSHWATTHFDLGRTQLQIGDLGSGNIAEGTTGPNVFMLYLPLTSGIRYTLRGHEIGQDAAAVMEPGSEFCFSTQDPHRWAAISVPVEGELRSEPYDPKAARAVPVELGRDMRGRLDDLVAAISTVAKRVPDFDATPAAHLAAEDLLAAAEPYARALLGKGRRAKTMRPLPKWAIVQRSHDYLEEFSPHAISVRGLADGIGVSERGLREAFTTVYGVSPKRYLLLRQLSEVRRGLLSAGRDGATVTQVLTTNGVWEFGRFAERYRGQYGETPSETLRAVL